MRVLICLAGLSLVWLLMGRARAAEEPGDDVLEMIVQLVKEQDRDMRGLAFQQIREEIPGERATKKLAAVLPELVPEAQAGLLEALGDRRDAAARPAVLAMLDSKEELVRAAALRALGNLGTEAEVSLLAQQAAKGSPVERESARQSLVRLRGAAIQAAMAAALDQATPEVEVELLAALGGRNAKDVVSKILERGKSQEPAVRQAALGALRLLADEKDTAAMTALLKIAATEQERRSCELALLALCSRGREACVPALIAAMADASTESRTVLLRALGRAGGDKALSAIAGCLSDRDEAVHTEAVRLISSWPGPNAMPHLWPLAGQSSNPRDKILAIRGLVRLASPAKDRPADLDALAKVLSLSDRPDERRCVLAGLSGVADAKSVALIQPVLKAGDVKEEASLALVLIAEKWQAGDKSVLRSPLAQLLKSTQDAKLRQRAEQVLKSIESR